MQLDPVQLSEEMSGAPLGDRRLNRRQARIVQRLATNPSAGFPKSMVSNAELEAAYRFFSNEAVTAEAVLTPHYEATCRRMEEESLVIVAHDTTSFEYGNESLRAGLGPIRGSNRQGLLAHLSLALEGHGRKPLGSVKACGVASPGTCGVASPGNGDRARDSFCLGLRTGRPQSHRRGGRVPFAGRRDLRRNPMEPRNGTRGDGPPFLEV